MRIAIAFAVMLLSVVPATAEDKYSLSWTSRTTGVPLVFAAKIVDSATDVVLISPKVSTSGSPFSLKNTDAVPGVTLEFSGTPVDASRWTLHLRATRGSDILQDTTYDVSVPTERQPYNLSWTAVPSGKSVVFSLDVSEFGSGKVLYSPRVTTPGPFSATTRDVVPDTDLEVRGTRIDANRWELGLKATKAGKVLQDTTYVATAAPSVLPYVVRWTVEPRPQPVSFAFNVSESEKAIFDGKVLTQWSPFSLTNKEAVPGVVFEVIGKPADASNWALTLRASRDGELIQETQYKAPLTR